MLNKKIILLASIILSSMHCHSNPIKIPNSTVDEWRANKSMIWLSFSMVDVTTPTLNYRRYHVENKEVIGEMDLSNAKLYYRVDNYTEAELLRAVCDKRGGKGISWYCRKKNQPTLTIIVTAPTEPASIQEANTTIAQNNEHAPAIERKDTITPINVVQVIIPEAIGQLPGQVNQ